MDLYMMMGRRKRLYREGNCDDGEEEEAHCEGED